MSAPGFFERVLDRLFEYQLILAGCEADSQDPNRPVYLKRYFLVTASDPARSAGQFHRPRVNLTVHRKIGGQVLLHKICMSDGDRELHDHPWNFTSIILWRGYVEQTECPKCDRGLCYLSTPKRPGMILRRAAEHRHRVLIGDGPAWTLVFTSGRRKSWSFFRGAVAIPWREFISRKCAPDGFSR